MLSIHLLLPALLAIPTPQQPGGTLIVPTQFATIQSAITAAVTGDTVLVAPGTYPGNIDFLGKAITVKSMGGPASTTISGNGSGSVVTFTTGEGLGSVLEGFTITGGTGTLTTFTGMTGFVGGGIYCDGASPTIRDNIVSGNTLSGAGYENGGGGIVCFNNSSPLITRNIIELNTVSGLNSGGGGIACWSGSSPTICDNDIRLNSVTATNAAGAGGILCQLPGTRPTITHNRIYRNSAPHGGGMQCSGYAQPTITDNEIFENTATAAGGGIQFYLANNPVEIANNTFWGNTTPGNGGAVYCNTTSIATIRNSILWNNSAGTGNEIYVTNTASLTLAYCDVQGGQSAAFVAPTATLNWGAGMINLAPQFKGAAGGDFSLLGTSPCVDAGDPGSNRCLGRDIAGNPRLLDGLLSGTMHIDMGAHEFDNVHLAITGSPTPGGTLTFTTTGTPGLLVFLAVAGQPGDLCVPPLGSFFFNPASLWLSTNMGTIQAGPSSVTATVPPTMLIPAPIVFQEIALSLANPAGNISNAVQVTIQ